MTLDIRRSVMVMNQHRSFSPFTIAENLSMAPAHPKSTDNTKQPDSPDTAEEMPK